MTRPPAPRYLAVAACVGILASSLASVSPAAASGDLRIAAATYLAASYDPAIPEHPRNAMKNWSFGNPDVGGLLTVVVRNDGVTDAPVTSVTVGGTPLADLLAVSCPDSGLACAATPPRDVAWARWLPGPTIPAGGAATLQIKRSAATFGAGGTVGLAVTAGGMTAQSSIALMTPQVRLGSIYLSGSDAVLFVRNDGLSNASVQNVQVDGAPAAWSATGGVTTIDPGAVAILTVGGRFSAGDVRAFTVGTSAGDVTATLRLFLPTFPIGTWITDGWNDPAFLQAARARYIDTSWGYASTLDVARQYGFKLIIDSAPCTSPSQTPADNCVPASYRDVVAAYAMGDEVEFSQSVSAVQQRDAAARAGDPTRPTFVNLAAQRTFQEYLPITDVGSMDHYTSGIGLCTITTAQPSSMQGQPVEWAGNYAAQMKANNEPNPSWTWSQAGNGKNLARTCWHGTPTPQEMEGQLFSELAAGVKGILWFIFGGQNDVTYSPKLWARVGPLDATLVVTRPWLSGGDLSPSAVIPPAATQAGAIVSPDAVVIPLLNLSYTLKPKGYVWAPQQNVSVPVMLPAWLRGSDISAWQVVNGRVVDVPWARGGDTVTITVPTLTVGAQLVVGPASTRASMEALQP